jgi:hypothetical protein
MEAKYAALSASLCDINFVMQLLNELIFFGIQLVNVIPEVKCKVFENNVGTTIELAKGPQMHPLIKHIDIQYHHSHEGVQQKKNWISHLSTQEQVVNIATKPLPKSQFQYLC